MKDMDSSMAAHDGPRTGSTAHWVARFWLRITGWHVVGQIPPGGKFVLICAPHTSNWDLPFGLAALAIFGLKVSWMGKHSLFKKPFGGIMRLLGGIAINRGSAHLVVEQIAQLFQDSKKLVVVVTPSGTRAKRDYWKSGFYRIAQAAQVPLLCGYLDYENKEARIGLSFVPTGSVKEDMARIREFYKDIQGKYPELTTRIRLRGEDG